MNYIQINIGGKDRGLKFNQLSLEAYTKCLNYEYPNSSSIYATFYAGLVGNCCAKKIEEDFTFEDVTDWVDALYEEGKKDEIEKVCKLWAETNVYKEWLKEFQERLTAILQPEKKTKKKVK